MRQMVESFHEIHRIDHNWSPHGRHIYNVVLTYDMFCHLILTSPNIPASNNIHLINIFLDNNILIFRNVLDRAS